MKKEIQPHQVRVISEYFSLDKKFKDLQKFVTGTGMFHSLPGEEKHLLKQQLDTMSSYRAVLHSRLALWGLKPSDMSENDKLLAGVLTEIAATVSPKDGIIKRAKELRVAIDSILQDVKAFGKDCLSSPCIDAPHADGFEFFADPQEVPANAKICQRHLEDAVMRLGMTLKAIGSTNPYPQSYNPESTTVEPTADGLKL